MCMCIHMTCVLVRSRRPLAVCAYTHTRARAHILIDIHVHVRTYIHTYIHTHAYICRAALHARGRVRTERRGERAAGARELPGQPTARRDGEAKRRAGRLALTAPVAGRAPREHAQAEEEGGEGRGQEERQGQGGQAQDNGHSGQAEDSGYSEIGWRGGSAAILTGRTRATAKVQNRYVFNPSKTFSVSHQQSKKACSQLNRGVCGCLVPCHVERSRPIHAANGG